MYFLVICGQYFILKTVGNYQGCSGAGTRRSAVPANIFEPERHSGKYCVSQAEH